MSLCWTHKLIVVVQLLAFIATSADSFSLTMKAGGSGSKQSLMFVTNKMCPFAQKAWIALEASQVPYKFEQVSLYGAGGKPSWFMKLNPKGQVPVLVVNNDDEKNKVVLADSDLILDEMDMVVNSLESSMASINLITAPEDEATLAKIKAFRSALNSFLPIGKSAVLGGDIGQMWSKLRELDALVETQGSCFLAGTEKPTVADCSGFPFLWRIDNEYGSDAWKSNGCENIPVWLDLCREHPAFAKSVQSSWWWWW